MIDIDHVTIHPGLHQKINLNRRVLPDRTAPRIPDFHATPTAEHELSTRAYGIPDKSNGYLNWTFGTKFRHVSRAQTPVLHRPV